MDMETQWSCPICHNTWNDVASTLPCHHQFCLGCILRWVQINPTCPLCSRPVETVRFSEWAEQDCIQFDIRALEKSRETNSLAGRTPCHPPENSPHRSVLLLPCPPQGTSSPSEQGAAGTELLGAIHPEVWAGLFHRQQDLLSPVRAFLHCKLPSLYRQQWWRAEAVEASIVHGFCTYGLNAEALVQVLQPILNQHTALLIHSVISVIVHMYSEDTQTLLDFHQTRDQDIRPVASNSSSSSSSNQEIAPISSPAVSKVEKEAGTSQTGPQGIPSCPQPVPNPAEQEQPQEEPEQPLGAGPCAQGSSCSPSAPTRGRNCLPGGSQHPPKRRVSSPQGSP
ncbi:hypothetical protein WISP_94965 [Willisornis vidua]|uniref:RING-type domain-containing protein n=1 Tax=Willisornis vidua TaxID=1566151 RepID=A0ABQ9D063_9PASS|nr:hypothetical protein WISP_94965 [Willisornis vidua]